jgi:tetratricopeptide (TPR) repeat protein
MNILIHALASLLLIVALKQMGVPGAWLAGLIFAIHPVHVESVAWVSERKNTLSLVFYLLTFIAYFKFERTKRWAFYGWALAAFVAACLCKSHVVVLPFALVLYCWWKRGRITREDLIRIIPFFVLSVICAVLTVYLQHLRAIGQEEIENFGGWGSRFAMAGMSSWWYLYKAIIPARLITIYPIWPIIPFNPYQLLYGVAMLGLVAGLFIAMRRYPKPWIRACFFALAYFLATLLPVMGFIKMSYMRVTLAANWFQYLPDIGIIALGCAGAAILYERLHGVGRQALVGAVCAVVLTFSAYSWNRAGTFQGEETLWTDTLSKNENTWQAHNHMGAILYMRQDYKKAIYHFKRGVDLRPGNCEVQNNLGLVLAAMGNLDAALIRYAEAVRIKGDDSSIRTNYANGLSQAKRYEEAVVQYRAAAKLPSQNTPGIYFNLGNTLLMESRASEAIEAYKEALKLAPNFTDAQRNLEYAQRQVVLSPEAAK